MVKAEMDTDFEDECKEIVQRRVKVTEKLKKIDKDSNQTANHHVLREGHKILRNLHLTFDWHCKSKVKILQIFVAFSEYMNFTTKNM